MSRPVLSPALIADLERQNAVLAPSSARKHHLAALSDERVQVVVTGQQLGLFLGPAYSVYKAATAIVLARQLQALSGRPTVPLFWLQSEDHDAAEVASAAVLGSDDELATVTLQPAGEARAAMGERPLGDGVIVALDQLEQALEDSPHRHEALALMRRHYRPELGWLAAFANTMGEVFAAEGLLLLDPRSQIVAELARPLHRRAFEAATALDEALQQGVSLIEDAGETALVRPRPGCSLSFYHPAGPSGARYRLVQVAGGWALPGSSECLSTAALSQQIERSPRHFSTSALLRVVLQNSLLPTAAQVAGPGEARYLRQMPPLLAAFGLAAPALVPRGRLLVTDKTSRRRLAALGVAASQVTDRDGLLRQLARQDAGPDGEQVAARLTAALAGELEALGPVLQAIDPALSRSLERTGRHIARGVSGLATRVDRARARRDATRVDRVERLCRQLLPGGAPQERVLALPHFVARFGLEPFKAGIFATIEAQQQRGELGQLAELAL